MLSQLNDPKLVSLGLENKEDRKAVMNALRKAGYCTKLKPSSKIQLSPAAEASGSFSPASSSTRDLKVTLHQTTPTKRKRKRVSDSNEFLPEGSPDEIENTGSFDFGEVLDEEARLT